MAILDKTQLQALIDSVITANANNEITGSVLNGVLTDMIDSLVNIITDADSIGFYQYDTAKEYNTGELTYFNSNFYISKEVQTAGSFAPAKWIAITSYTDNADFNLTFQIYSPVSVYNIGDKVRYNNQYFICDLNGTTGTDPDDADPAWSSAYVHNGDESKEWAAGYYLQGQRVTFNGKRYYLTFDTIGGAYLSSTDPVTDAANWDQFNMSTGSTPDLFQVLTAGNKTTGLDIKLSDFGRLIFEELSGNVLTNPLNLALLAYDINNKLAFASTDGASVGVEAGKGFIKAKNTTLQVIDDNRFELLDLKNSKARFDTNLIAATNTRTYQLPDLDGTLAVTSQLPINYRRYVGENVVGTTILTNTNQTLTISNPPLAGAGTYWMYFQCEVVLTGDEDVIIELVDGASIKEIRNIANNQGGGGARSTRHSVSFECPAFNYNAGTILSVRARKQLAGAAEIQNGLYRVWKLNN